jgi:hypothetical protein
MSFSKQVTKPLQLLDIIVYECAKKDVYGKWNMGIYCEGNFYVAAASGAIQPGPYHGEVGEHEKIPAMRQVGRVAPRDGNANELANRVFRLPDLVESWPGILHRGEDAAKQSLLLLNVTLTNPIRAGLRGKDLFVTFKCDTLDVVVQIAHMSISNAAELHFDTLHASTAIVKLDTSTPGAVNLRVYGFAETSWGKMAEMVSIPITKILPQLGIVVGVDESTFRVSALPQHLLKSGDVIIVVPQTPYTTKISRDAIVIVVNDKIFAIKDYTASHSLDDCNEMYCAFVRAINEGIRHGLRRAQASVASVAPKVPVASSIERALHVARTTRRVGEPVSTERTHVRVVYQSSSMGLEDCATNGVVIEVTKPPTQITPATNDVAISVRQDGVLVAQVKTQAPVGALFDVMASMCEHNDVELNTLATGKPASADPIDVDTVPQTPPAPAATRSNASSPACKQLHALEMNAGLPLARAGLFDAASGHNAAPFMQRLANSVDRAPSASVVAFDGASSAAASFNIGSQLGPSISEVAATAKPIDVDQPSPRKVQPKITEYVKSGEGAMPTAAMASVADPLKPAGADAASTAVVTGSVPTPLEDHERAELIRLRAAIQNQGVPTEQGGGVGTDTQPKPTPAPKPARRRSAKSATIGADAAKVSEKPMPVPKAAGKRPVKKVRRGSD